MLYITIPNNAQAVKRHVPCAGFYCLILIVYVSLSPTIMCVLAPWQRYTYMRLSLMCEWCDCARDMLLLRRTAEIQQNPLGAANNYQLFLRAIHLHV